MTFPRFIAAILTLLAAAGSQAFEFKTVGANPAILYDAPSLKGSKLFIAPRGMPVEIVLSYGEWVKVRDVSGDLAWTEMKNLSSKCNVVVRAAGTKIHATDDEASPVLLQLDKGVLLEMLSTEVSAWIQVRHRDGAVGFIKASEVWGI